MIAILAKGLIQAFHHPSDANTNNELNEADEH